MKGKQKLDLSVQNFFAIFMMMISFSCFIFSMYVSFYSKVDVEVCIDEEIQETEEDFVYKKYVQYLDVKEKSNELVTNDEEILVFEEGIVENTVEDVVIIEEVNDVVINEVHDVDKIDMEDVVKDDEINTEENFKVPSEYSAVYEVKATAYCLCKKCCGKSPDHPYYGVTRSGIKIVPGTGMKVIAVDKNIIPLGSKVFVEGLYGAADYGYAIAADTGSAIKNYKIDLYMDTHQEAYRWGVKTVRLYVL